MLLSGSIKDRANGLSLVCVTVDLRCRNSHELAYSLSPAVHRSRSPGLIDVKVGSGDEMKRQPVPWALQGLFVAGIPYMLQSVSERNANMNVGNVA